MARAESTLTQAKFSSRCVTIFIADFFRLSAGYDMVPGRLSRVLLPAVQGQTRRKPGTQSFRSVSDR